MNIPTTNPHLSAYDQIYTPVNLNDANIVELIHEFHGEDAAIIAIGRGGHRGWVRVNCWIHEQQDFENCWIWICNDFDEYQTVFIDYELSS
jgi:hypothetical protein